jgi:hypothetical protein
LPFFSSFHQNIGTSEYFCKRPSDGIIEGKLSGVISKFQEKSGLNPENTEALLAALLV